MSGSRARGFTLLEVTIALIIAALALGLFFRTAATGIRSARLAGLHQEALSRAQSHLDAIGAPGVSLVPRTESGAEDHGFRWEISIEPVATAPVVRQRSDGAPGGVPRLTLFALRVTESWKNEAGHGAITLATRRLAPAAP